MQRLVLTQYVPPVELLLFLHLVPYNHEPDPSTSTPAIVSFLPLQLLHPYHCTRHCNNVKSLLHSSSGRSFWDASLRSSKPL
jgi:hypothetical protein